MCLILEYRKIILNKYLLDHIKRREIKKYLEKKKRNMTKVILYKKRIVIEHIIYRIKKYRIMSNIFRNKIRKYNRVSDIVSGLINYIIMNQI